ncbi:hypothetical protein AgCh_037419 [Apium graveolens]
MKRQASRKVLKMVMMMILVVFSLNLPPEMKKLIGGTRKPEWTGGMVAIELMSQIKKLVEKRVRLSFLGFHEPVSLHVDASSQVLFAGLDLLMDL